MDKVVISPGLSFSVRVGPESFEGPVQSFSILYYDTEFYLHLKFTGFPLALPWKQKQWSEALGWLGQGCYVQICCELSLTHRGSILLDRLRCPHIASPDSDFPYPPNHYPPRTPSLSPPHSPTSKWSLQKTGSRVRLCILEFKTT